MNQSKLFFLNEDQMRWFWNYKIGTIRKLSLTHLQWRGVFLIRGTLNPDPVYFVKTKLCFRWIGPFSGCRCSPCRGGRERRRWRSAGWTSKHWRKIDWKIFLFFYNRSFFTQRTSQKEYKLIERQLQLNGDKRGNIDWKIEKSI